jgi:hypothetical protein
MGWLGRRIEPLHSGISLTRSIESNCARTRNGKRVVCEEGMERLSFMDVKIYLVLED